MSEPQRVMLDGVDWRSAMPWLRLFRSFSMAIQPGRLLLAVLLILLLYLGGTAMDFAWGKRVNPNELNAYATYDAQRYALWLEHTGQPAQTDYIFQTLVKQQVTAFEKLIVSATDLNFGLSTLATGRGEADGVIGALMTMVVHIPGWLYASHTGFLIVYLLYAFALTTLFGGAICRVAAIDACRDTHISAFEGLGYAFRHWTQIMLAPLIPLAIVIVIRLLLAVAGFVFFNVVGLDILGAAIYGLFLAFGFIAALLLIGFTLGVNLLTPAVAVDAADAFEAVGRVYNYVVGRIWRYLFYTAVVIVYGALAYLLVGLVVFSTIWLTRSGLAIWSGGEVAHGVSRLDAVMPHPAWGSLLTEADWDKLDRTGTVTAVLIMVWNRLLIAVLPAFAVSYYFNAQTWVYLLLRRSADRVELDEVYTDPDPDQPPAPLNDKLEPEQA